MGREQAEDTHRAGTESRHDSCAKIFLSLSQFKLLIAGNHKPSIRTVDEAMRASSSTCSPLS